MTVNTDMAQLAWHRKSQKIMGAIALLRNFHNKVLNPAKNDTGDHGSSE